MRCTSTSGAHGTARLATTSEIQWRETIDYYHHHGPASSPVVYGDLLILTCDGFTEPFYDDRRVEGLVDPQFLIALDKQTGREVWRKPRAGRHSYCTPLIISAAGRDQLIIPGGDAVTSYDPANGTEWWRVQYTGYSVVPRPVFSAPLGLVYITTGFDEPTLAAIAVDGDGDVTNTHVRWHDRRSVPLNASLLLAGERLYSIADKGICTCWNAATGELLWRQRLRGAFSASPLLAGDRIYISSEEGLTYVLADGDRFQRLKVNRLKGRIKASLAAVDDALIIRTDKELLRIEEGE